MKRLILSILIVLGIFYFFQAPTIADADKNSIHTLKDAKIASEEDQLSIEAHFDRFIHFRKAVEIALQRRVSPEKYVPSDDIAPVMKQAIVATEDRRYYDHGALDFYGIIRALYTNLIAGYTVEGGSTITQQLVKNLFLTDKRVLSRKVEEVGLAFLMEHYYTKDEILTMYLNSIYYGNDYNGIAEASHGYFGCKPSQLDLAQAALLAGLPQAPSYYNPYHNAQAAATRRSIVLALMKEQGYINEMELYKASDEALALHIDKKKKPIRVDQ